MWLPLFLFVYVVSVHMLDLKPTSLTEKCLLKDAHNMACRPVDIDRERRWVLNFSPAETQQSPTALFLFENKVVLLDKWKYIYILEQLLLVDVFYPRPDHDPPSRLAKTNGTYDWHSFSLSSCMCSKLTLANSSLLYCLFLSHYFILPAFFCSLLGCKVPSQF